MLFVKLTGGPFLRGQYFEICRFLDNINNIKNMYIATSVYGANVSVACLTQQCCGRNLSALCGDLKLDPDIEFLSSSPICGM